MNTVFKQLLKVFLHLIVILKYPINKEDQELAKLTKFYENDKSFCPECFEGSFEECFKIKIEFDDDFVGSLNTLFGVKQTRYGRLKDNDSKIVIKYLGNSEKFNYILGGFGKHLATSNSYISSEHQDSEKILRELFFDKSRIDGCQFCPPNSIDDFVQLIGVNLTKFSSWVHLNVNIQPLLLPILYRNNFPVPKFYHSCGFTIFESYEGFPLVHYYSSPFDLKIRIALQLLEAALRFTQGFEGYKLYLTDINSDNIVYNKLTNKVSFIDLDSVIVVDSLYHVKRNISLLEWETVQKHEIIECNGCFAYAPSEICSHHESDINIYAICQLLREDLYGNASEGFLYPIPEDIIVKYQEFVPLLNTCVRCEVNCTNRLESAYRLLTVFRKIIYN